MRTEFKSADTTGKKHTAQLASTKGEGTEAWIVIGVTVVGLILLVWLLTKALI